MEVDLQMADTNGRFGQAQFLGCAKGLGMEAERAPAAAHTPVGMQVGLHGGLRSWPLAL
jgi:hypothetical protein